MLPPLVIGYPINVRRGIITPAARIDTWGRMSISDIPHIFGTGPLSETGIKPTRLSLGASPFIYQVHWTIQAFSTSHIDYHAKEKDGS